VGRVRVPYFCDLLARLKSQSLAPDPARDIVRQPGNPLLRYAPAAATDPDPPNQESLL
jgi:hypothetical protein